MILCPKCETKNEETQQFCVECGTDLSTLHPTLHSDAETLEYPVSFLTSGAIFAGRYQIIEILGQGGMGIVYRALDRELKEEIALKVVKPEVSFNKNAIESLKNEIKIARGIRHRNVTHVYELMEDNGIYFITMEYVPGEDLESFIKRARRLDVEAALSISIQICQGLREAHNNGVIHRDLKPSNIIIDKNGNARIMDFGISCLVEDTNGIRSGKKIGTLWYMSPEQIEGKKLDQRSDIYSLGVILYKMLTGDVPLDKIFQSKIVSGHKADPPEDPVLINPHIPLKFSALILKCLEGDREVRYQTVDEILSGLRNLEEEFSISHEKGIKGISRLSTEYSTVKRIKKYLPFSLVLLAVILVGIIWKPWSGLKAPFSQVDRSSVAVLYFENLSSDSDLESWRMGLTELLITDLMQSKFIDVLSSDRIYSLLNALELLKVEKYSTENLAEIADRGHVSYVISGGLLKAGEEIIITLFIKEHRTGEILDSLRVQCANEDQIVRVVDELTQMIKSSLSLSSEQISGDLDKDVGKITTNSTEAFKYYVRALNHINRDEYPQGIECLEKATNVDPGFALAYRLLGVAYRDQGYFEKGRENLKKAFELADRVSERESLQIQGDFYRSSWTTYDKAFKTYQRLLELYPDDHNGVTSLARLYTAIEDWDSAINLYSKNIRNKVGIYFSYGNIATLYLQKGQYERAVDIVDSYSKEYSDNAPLRWRSVYAHVAQGHYDSACKEMDKAIALNPSDYFNFLIKGDIYHAFGDVEKAQKEYEKSLQGIDRTMILYGRKRLAALFALQGSFVQAIEQIREGLVLAEELGDQTWKAELKLYLSYLYNRLGQPDRAIVECSEVLSIADHFGEFGMYKKALFFLAMSYIEQMSMSKASEVISQIKDISEQGTNRRGMRYYYHLAGRKALSEGKTQIAIEDFQKAIPLLPSQSWPDIDDHALFIEPLAEAFKIAGDLESAEEQYLNILSLRSGRIHYGDIYAKSFYELGRIYEEKGKSKKAVSYYQRYLFYREKADQSHPEITDAAKRLANLKKS